MTSNLQGGAIYARGSSSNPVTITILDTKFESNTATTRVSEIFSGSAFREKETSSHFLYVGRWDLELWIFAGEFFFS